MESQNIEHKALTKVLIWTEVLLNVATADRRTRTNDCLVKKERKNVSTNIHYHWCAWF